MHNSMYWAVYLDSISKESLAQQSWFLYSSQHLNWIKKKLIKVVLRQEHILVLGFRTTFMKGFDSLQLLTSMVN